MIIVDTGVVAELMRPSPYSLVRQWVRLQDRDELYTTTITVAEICHGIERLADEPRRDALRATADELFSVFDERVLPFDRAAAAQYALVVTDRADARLPIGGMDAQIAAVCRARGATLATRDVAQFRRTGIDVVDPWRPYH